MKLLWTLLFLLLLSPCESRPPETTSVSPPAQVSVTGDALLFQVSPTAPSLDQRRFHRLPGLCRRLKRRRITYILINLCKCVSMSCRASFLWAGCIMTKTIIKHRTL
uniref:Uncharacterized protein n=1 Tax=Neogobius melanostomus TaxID=47308 RepID=A0A8C6U3I5_9GOBI